MYMYLSDRIRRMFLSGACPQNLSPKTPLSLKDLRFLQKTGIEKNLTRTVVKQQKVLYEKHIGFFLKVFGESNTQKNYKNLLKREKEFWDKTPVYLHVSCKTQKTIKTLKYSLQSKLSSLKDWFTNPLQNPKRALEIPKIMKNKALVAPKAGNAFSGLALFGQKEDLSGPAPKGLPKGFHFQGMPFYPAGAAPLGQALSRRNPKIEEYSKKTKHINFKEITPFRLTKPKEKLFKGKSQGKAQLSPLPLSSICFINRKPLVLFVQSIKVPEKELFFIKNNKQSKIHLFSQQGQTLNGGKKNSDFSLSTSPGSHPLIKGNPFVNGKNQFNCRYLYNRESLKTCIVPQIFKNQKPVSRAKTLLHERKKISLLYGQLTKKDIGRLSRKAVGIPGFFEDNMFTLLESRVDVCVFRAGFSKTIAAARQLIRNGSVLVNGKKLSSSKSRAKPGDLFTFAFKQQIVTPYKCTTLELYNLYTSSNFLAVSKNKFFRQNNQPFFFNNNALALATLGRAPLGHGQGHKPQRGTGANKLKVPFPESKLYKRFIELIPHEHFELSLCHSLFWGFFIYKLYEKKILFFNTNNRCHKKHNCLAPFGFQDAQLGKYVTNCLQQKSQKLLKRQKTQSKMSFGLGKSCRAKSIKNKNIVFFNLYTQLLLKKLFISIRKTRENSGASLNPLFRKSISSSNLWAIWGQKPLHLEISHKTGTFIYMYKPQKIISPVCFDWKL